MSPRRASCPLFASLAAGLRLGCLVAPLLLAACASSVPPQVPAVAGVFDDAAFGPPQEPVSTDGVLAMSPQMQAYLTGDIEPMVRAKGARAALVDALYNRRKLQLEYESSLTRNAAQAFDARQGNCLSLVLMTGAFAKAMGLKVTYQQVAVDEMWSRSAGMYFMSGHVNLLLQRPAIESHSHFDHGEFYTIDFMPGEDHPGLVRTITEETLLAMYMSNRAAEALVAGHLDDAYWRLHTALRLDPGFVGAYNTLGVVYLRHGDAARAERVLRGALAVSPDSPALLANDAEALHQLGREPEAQAAREHLARVEPTPPFYWFVRGQAALRAGDFVGARTLFLKEIAREPDYHEFHYALAIADFGLGRVDEARHELGIALQDAVKRSDHDLYAAKLDKLRGLQRNAPPTAPTVQ